MTRFALLLFPGITQLDLTAPYEVFNRAPDAQVDLVWKDMAPVRTEHGLTLAPTITLDALSAVDVLCVPGGFGVNPLLTDDTVLDAVRRLAIGARYVTSVCTGALVLGAAGLLRGRRAVTHWTAMQYLPAFGAIPTPGRWVEDDGVITGGGVTAGLDFALHVVAALHGDGVAQAIQLALEYDPCPPFACGRPDQAPPPLLETMSQRLEAAQHLRAEQVTRAAQRLAAV